MATYVDLDDVRPRIGGRPLTASSEPSQTDVSSWLDQLEAELLGELAAVGIESTEFSSRGALIVTGWLGEAAAGLVQTAHAAAAGNGSNPDGQARLDRWAKLLEDIRSAAPSYRQKLCGADASGASSLLRANAARDPWITTDEKF